MPTQQIQHADWRSALDSFSRNHQGWSAVLEEAAADTGTVGKELPFVGVSADERDGEEEIAIMLGTQPDDHLTHIVNAPAQVQITGQENGGEESLEIVARDGGRTVLRCHQ